MTVPAPEPIGILPLLMQVAQQVSAIQQQLKGLCEARDEDRERLEAVEKGVHDQTTICERCGIRQMLDDARRGERAAVRAEEKKVVTGFFKHMTHPAVLLLAGLVGWIVGVGVEVLSSYRP